MLFNSFLFLAFLVIVFVLYWFVFKNHLKIQNTFLLISSYIFYACWDYRFLSLIVFSTVMDFFLAKYIHKSKDAKQRKQLLAISLIVNLGLLGFFKYYNFFIESWVDLSASIGVRSHLTTLKIILPIGISFYTFQTLSYTIDVYRNKLQPSESIIDFATFVTFFPQLVAGPIERATNLLPQFYKKRIFNFELAKSGLHLMVWGLFKKVVIADTCAIYVNEIFSNYQELSSLSLVLGAVYFAFQIYADFSGYSDMAIGMARLFGFNLMQNFNYPYFSRNIGEFWRRWHISLSTWFRDYLYIPLGGSKGSKVNQVRNVFVIFLVSGFWHGANWTFIFWGFLNALYFLPLLLTNRNRTYVEGINLNSIAQTLKTCRGILMTFSLTCIAWIFFRANSLFEAFNYIQNIGQFNLKIDYLNIERYAVEALLLVGFFVFIEWFNKHKEEPLSGRFSTFKLVTCVLLIFMLGSFSQPQEFIYFQF